MRIPIALALMFVLVFSSCAWIDEEPQGDVKRPDKANVLKYASDEQARLYRHKISPSLYRYGVPSYSLRNGGMVELVVQFNSRIPTDYAKRIVEPMNGRVKNEVEGGLLIIMPEWEFWNLTKHEHVEFVTIEKAPRRLNR